ncbi:hypothetical protein Tco_0681690 [Tanacetum coccineum]|uniref:Uncharacterized protein n=1 Tax=Tanacetum coccineum TaxID=301880 RepID=A0ABQ4XQM3_9ASTR
MAAPGARNQTARRVIDDLVDFSGETSVQGYMKFFKAQQLAKTYRFLNRMHEEAQTVRNLIARRVKDAKLMGLNDLITQAEEDIKMKEAQLEVDYVACYAHFDKFDVYVTIGILVKLPKHYVYVAVVHRMGSRVPFAVGGIMRKPTSLKAIDIECVVESLPEYNVSGTVLEFLGCVLYH